MIQIALPMFFTNFKFNQSFISFCNLFPESLKIPVNFSSVYGNFPYCYFEGNINNNYGSLALYEDFSKISFLSLKPIRFDCSNIFITLDDLFNNQLNTFLKLNEMPCNTIEISNLSILNNFKEKFPNFNFILSKNINLISPASEEIYQEFIKSNLFTLIELPSSFKANVANLHLPKNKIEFTILERCKCYNNNEINNCAMIEHKNQINFSNKTIYNDCSKLNDYNDITIDYNEFEMLISLGYKNFKIDTCPLNQLLNFNNYLIKFFIKPEYQLECKIYIEKNMEN